MKILCCNIRYFGADDGDNNWVHRRDICAEIMLAHQPDIICVQEMWQQQFDDLVARLPGFASYGLMHAPTSRHPANCIFYKAERFEWVTAAGYWLSETPHIPGSKSWESHGERLANWIRLIDGESGVEFRVINTHLDHISAEARKQQAAVIGRESAAYPEAYPQILVGDMNCDRRHEPLAVFARYGWVDTYETIHGVQEAGCTFHNFLGPAYEANFGKIDWIFVKGDVQTVDAEIIKDHVNGRYPSDHYFVSAEVQLL